MFRTTAFSILLAVNGSALADTEILSGTNLGTDFGVAALSGNGLSINAMNLPIHSGTTITYVNAVFTLGLLNDGTPALLLNGYTPASGAAQTPSGAMDNFSAGLYKDNLSGAEYELIGPSIGTDGRRIWTLVPSRGATWGATWATGPATGNPVINNWSNADYSLATSGPAYGIDTANYAISAIQVMNAITINKYQKISTGSVSTAVLRKE